MKRFRISFFILLSLTGCLVASTEAFDFSSRIVEPEVLRTVSLPIEDSLPDVTAEGLVFRSDYAIDNKQDEQVNEVFAVLVRPNTPGPHPGLVLLHGGGGSAEINRAIEWASLGYVVISPDLPGIASPEKVPNSKGQWTSEKYAANRWTYSPDISASTIYQAVLAAIESYALLAAQPDVDSQYIGVTGISWGGYMTTMLCGILGDRVQAGFSNYGCGFYDEATFKGPMSRMPKEEREMWMRDLDAGRRAHNITAPFFIAAATNDKFFFPPAVDHTLAEIPGKTNQVYAPNSHHRLPLPGGTQRTGGPAEMSKDWFGWYLKGEGQPFPSVTILSEDNGVLRFNIQSPKAVESISLWYSEPNADMNWPKRNWLSINIPVEKENEYQVKLPDSAVGDHCAYFILISTTDNISVSSRLVIRKASVQ